MGGMTMFTSQMITKCHLCVSYTRLHPLLLKFALPNVGSLVEWLWRKMASEQNCMNCAQQCQCPLERRSSSDGQRWHAKQKQGADFLIARVRGLTNLTPKSELRAWHRRTSEAATSAATPACHLPFL